MRKRFFQTLMFAAILVTWAGCDKKEDGPPRYTISGNGTGNQEVPAVTTSGTSTVTGTYISGDKQLNFSVSFSNLSSNAIGMHFHGPADPGQNANVMIPVTNFPQATSGNFSGTATLTAEQEAALLNGKMYFNIHTVNFESGEVRAQIGTQQVGG